MEHHRITVGGSAFHVASLGAGPPLVLGFSYPGIGPRMATPDRLTEIWYQSFHQMPMAASLVGASRDTCRAYIGHFLRHWSHRKDAFDDVLEAWVDNFLAPGNL